MKRFLYIPLILLCLSACKTNDWVDWKAQNEMFLLANAEKTDIKTTPSGLQYRIIDNGNITDTKPNPTSTILCDYKLWFVNGKLQQEVDGATITLSTAVKGFVEGMRMIHPNGELDLFIPWELGYGSEGYAVEGNDAFVPPYTTLIYHVHLSAISN